MIKKAIKTKNFNSINMFKNDKVEPNNQLESGVQSPLDEKYYFIHISKTAGTSFRIALNEEYDVLCDYGPILPETSPIIRTYIYDVANSWYDFKREFQKMGKTWITGHIPLNKYSDMVSVRNIITFVRDPVQRVVSHYNYAVACQDFKGDISEFLTLPVAANHQINMLNSLPLGLIGYIGLTDCYDESIQLLNNEYGLQLAVKKENVNNQKRIEKESITNELKAEITALNDLDIKCIEEARFLYQQQRELMQQGQDWVYCHFNINPNNVLNGCAYYRHSDDAVELDVYCNGEWIHTLFAQRFYGAFPKANFPRERYIGVHYPLPKSCKKGDTIELIAKKTGQKLLFSPLKSLK